VNVTAAAPESPRVPAPGAGPAEERTAGMRPEPAVWSPPGKLAGAWLVGLAVLHLLLGLDQARRHSVTHDEYWHLPAGVAGWREGRFDLDNLNPPLTRLVCSLPALWQGVELPTGLPPDDAFRLGDEFLRANREQGQRPWIWARGLNLWLSLFTAAVLWWWGAAWLGRGAGLFAASLWLTCPLVLGHASLVTPDVGSTLLFVATLAATHGLAHRPTPARAWATGVLLGLAQLTKFTNVLLLGLVPLTWMATRWWWHRQGRGEARRERPSRRLAGQSPGQSPNPGDSPGSMDAHPLATPVPARPGSLGPGRVGTAAARKTVPGESVVAIPPAHLGKSCGVVAGWALLVWNLGYLAQGTGSPLADYPLRSRALQTLRENWPRLAQVPLPIPRDYVAGFDRQRSIMEGSHPVYWDGTWRLEGVPEYYLGCAAVKWPHLTQGVVLLGLLGLVWRAGRGEWLPAVLLGVPVLAVWIPASLLGMQLGFRYVMPSVPLLYLVAGWGVGWLWQRPGWGLRWLGGVLLVCLGLGLRHHPHHLAYFNEWAGGPLGGRRYLADSNLDWGQDLLALRQWLQEHEIQRVGLAYFGMVPPAELGIDYELPPSREWVSRVGRPPPGWYAVSVNFVLGRPHTIRLPDGTIRGVGYQEYGYFRSLQRVACLGGSLDIYRVEPEGTGREIPGRRSR